MSRILTRSKVSTMTAEIVDLFPTGEQADDTVRRTIDGIIKGKGLRREDVARLAGIKRSTFFNRMRAHGSESAFRAGEVASLARVLGVSIEQLYTGLGGTFIPPAGGGAPGTPGLGLDSGDPTTTQEYVPLLVAA